MRPTALVVMGVAGCGKSTVAGLLADRLGWPLGEADDWHPAAKRRRDDGGDPAHRRRPRALAPRPAGLDRRARRRLRPHLLGAAAVLPGRPARCGSRVRFVHLDGSREELAARLAARTGHCMPPSLLDSQLALLEPLGTDEDGVVVAITGGPLEVADRAAEAVARQVSGSGNSWQVVG